MSVLAAVVALYPPGRNGDIEATIEYDDGDEWTGSLQHVYVVRGEEDEEAPLAVARPVAGAAADGRLPIATAVPVAGIGHSDAPVAVGRRV